MIIYGSILILLLLSLLLKHTQLVKLSILQEIKIDIKTFNPDFIMTLLLQ